MAVLLFETHIVQGCGAAKDRTVLTEPARLAAENPTREKYICSYCEDHGELLLATISTEDDVGCEVIWAFANNR